MAFNTNGTINPVEIIQYALKDTTSGNPNVVLPFGPTSGNLILAFFYQDITKDALNLTDWDYVDSISMPGLTAGTLWLLRRYVGESESETLPDLSNVTSTGHCRAIAVEIDKVCGDWLHEGMSYRDSDFSGSATSLTLPLTCPEIFSDFQLTIMVGLNGGGRAVYTPPMGWINLIQDDSWFPDELSGAVTLNIAYFTNYRETPTATDSWSLGTMTGAMGVIGIRSDGIAREPNGNPA